MSAVAVAEIDTGQFNRALERYLLLTSKSGQDALNGKARDLMLMAAHFTPKANKATIKAGIRSPPALAVWRTRQRFGFPPWKPRSSLPYTAADILNSKARVSRPSVGYMRSAFVKASKLFPRTEASKQADKDSGKHFGTKATGFAATLSSLMAMARCEWAANQAAKSPSEDKDAKQSIASDSFSRAVKVVYEDMRVYFATKAAKAAKQISAK